MIWKQYKNELIVALSFVFLLIAIGYKSVELRAKTESMHMTQETVSEFKELIVLKKRWLDKRTSKKLEKLRHLTAASNIKWQKKSKKLHAVFSNLSAKELNKIVNTILSLPVQIGLLEIKNSHSSYLVELKCKW